MRRDDTSATPSARRPPGRPPADEAKDVRERLLDAAAHRFAEDGFGATSLRSVARDAHVTPAMVNYYFGGKEGLYQALLERVFTSLLPRVSAVADEDGSVEATVERILALAHEQLLAEPWIAPLMLREVLSDEGSFRDRFVRHFAARAAERVTASFARGVERGRMRDDLDPQLVYVSFVSLLLFPLLARPVLEGVLGQPFDARFSERLRRHTRRLFLDGVRRTDAPASDPEPTP